jgi:hypothetical protein
LDASNNPTAQVADSGGGLSVGLPYKIGMVTDGTRIVVGEGSALYALDTNLAAQKVLLFDDGTHQATTKAVALTPAGGVVVVGHTGDDTLLAQQAWIISYDASWNVIFQESIGGAANGETFAAVVAAADGFYVAGSTTSFGAGMDDVWVLKLDLKGAIVWQTTIGSSTVEHAQQLISDGQLLTVVGATRSQGNFGYMMVAQLDLMGSVKTIKVYGDGMNDVNTAIGAFARNGGFVFVCDLFGEAMLVETLGDLSVPGCAGKNNFAGVTPPSSGAGAITSASSSAAAASYALSPQSRTPTFVNPSLVKTPTASPLDFNNCF